MTSYQLEIVHARCLMAVVLAGLVSIFMICALTDAPIGSLPYQVATIMWLPSLAAVPLSFFSARYYYRTCEAQLRFK